MERTAASLHPLVAFRPPWPGRSLMETTFAVPAVLPLVTAAVAKAGPPQHLAPGGGGCAAGTPVGGASPLSGVLATCRAVPGLPLACAAAVAGGAGASGRRRVERAAARPRPKTSKPVGFGDAPRSEVATKRRSPPPLLPLSDLEVQAVEASVELALETFGDAMITGLRDQGWWASEGAVLPQRLCQMLRQEVEALWHADRFKLSQTVRGTEYFDKENVYATEVDGGSYEIAPRMVHYTVTATRAVAARIREAFPDVNISDKYIGNKLNMCVGNGASFASHLDVGVAEKPFNRKLTLLLYLNAWRPALGGEITLLGEALAPEGATASGLPKSLAPVAGRWVTFWADQMLHRVEPSQAPWGMEDFRVSYTIWFCTCDDNKSSATASTGVAGFEEAPAFGSL